MGRGGNIFRACRILSAIKIRIFKFRLLLITQVFHCPVTLFHARLNADMNTWSIVTDGGIVAI